MTLRVDEHPLLPSVERQHVQFTFEGRQVDAYEGETIAAALHAAGVRVLARSFKYHRPRGLYCVGGYCPNCALRVDGLPGVSACVTPVRAGQVVEREHAWPSADHDALALLGRLAALFPVGFQYQRFVRSPALFRRWERLLARLAGMAAPPDAAAARAAAEAVAEVRDAAVVVVGGGAAGLAAALEGARAGAHVTLVEQESELGGKLLADTAVVGQERGFELARRLAAEARENAVEVLTEATAFGWYEEGCLAVAAPARLLVLRPRALVLATGSYDLALPFADGDLPGIFLASGARRLLHRDRVRPGGRAVVVAGNPDAYALAEELVAAGVHVCAVADLRDAEVAQADREASQLQSITSFAGVSQLRARGRSRVRALSFTSNGREHAVRCDTVCIAVGRRPALELLLQRTYAGSHLLESPHGPLDAAPAPPAAAADATWVAGSAAGAASTTEAVVQGTAAGRAAVESLAD